MAREKTIYRHIYFGDRPDHFVSDMFVEIENEANFVKPNGGFWASPVDCEYGFDQFFHEVHPHETMKEYLIELTDDAKVYHIRSYADLIGLPKNEESILESSYVIDFEKVYHELGYDAIEFHYTESNNTDGCMPVYNAKTCYCALYGWDCDSILIMNPNIVKEIKK